MGGVDEGVRYNCAVVIRTKKLSICFSDKALCRVSSGLIGGTPPNPSIAKQKCEDINYIFTMETNV